VGAKGNDGVAGNVGQTKNSIGYVEYAYAKQNKLTYAALVNKAGKTVQPTLASFQAAAANADWANAPGFFQILTDQPGDASWPITAATFILMYAEPADKAASSEALKFFDWAFEKGDAMAVELDYIPMPAAVSDLVRKSWANIRNKKVKRGEQQLSPLHWGLRERHHLTTESKPERPRCGPRELQIRRQSVCMVDPCGRALRSGFARRDHHLAHHRRMACDQNLWV
jgi:hypothetical protein